MWCQRIHSSKLYGFVTCVISTLHRPRFRTCLLRCRWLCVKYTHGERIMGCQFATCSSEGKVRITHLFLLWIKNDSSCLRCLFSSTSALKYVLGGTMVQQLALSPQLRMGKSWFVGGNWLRLIYGEKIMGGKKVCGLLWYSYPFIWNSRCGLFGNLERTQSGTTTKPETLGCLARHWLHNLLNALLASMTVTVLGKQPKASSSALSINHIRLFMNRLTSILL